jgi:hypothetical protein
MALSAILIWLFLALIVGVAADRRGRMGFGWFMLAVMLSPFIAGLLLLAMRNLADEPDLTTHRRCPDCAELVLRAARVCKHCGRQLEESPPPAVAVGQSTPSRRISPALGNLYIALAALFVAWLFFKAATAR